MKEVAPRNWEIHRQAVTDLGNLEFPQELDLRNNLQVIDFFDQVTGNLTSNIPGFEEGAILITGSLARGDASNNSDIDLLIILPEWKPTAISRVRNALELVVQHGYGIRLDVAGSFFTIPWLEEMKKKGIDQFSSTVGDETPVLAKSADVQRKIIDLFKLGKRGTLPERTWRRNHVYDPTVPGKKFNGLDLRIAKEDIGEVGFGDVVQFYFNSEEKDKNSLQKGVILEIKENGTVAVAPLKSEDKNDSLSIVTGGAMVDEIVFVLDRWNVDKVLTELRNGCEEEGITVAYDELLPKLLEMSKKPSYKLTA